MTLFERRQRYTDIGSALPLISDALAAREPVRVLLAERLADVSRPGTRADWHAKAELEEALSQLRDGIPHNGGIRFPELAPFVGKPGTLQLQRQLASLTREQGEHAAYLERWPTDDVRLPHRYSGAPFKARFDGRELQPGDVVDLNEAQARANADRFELVAAQ